jgi:uncharacterized protein
MRQQSDPLNKIRIILQSHPFIPSVFLKNPHLQTFLAPAIPYFQMNIGKKVQIQIPLSDGSQLVADCWWQKEKEKCATVVVLSGFEGYLGKEKSHFVKGMADKAFSMGYNIIHLKQRGEAESIHLTKSLFAADPLVDISSALIQLREMGLKKIYMVGISGGGWSILFSLTQLNSKIARCIAGVVSISSPANFLGTWDHVKKNQVYYWILLQAYKNFVRRRHKIDLPGVWNMDALKSAKTIEEWGEVFFPYSFGFKKRFLDIGDYHEKTDLKHFLPSVTIPTLLIHSHDDPVTPLSFFTHPSIQKNPWIISLFPKYGGHGGFIARQKSYGDEDRHWAQNRAIEFIRLLDKRVAE